MPIFLHRIGELKKTHSRKMRCENFRLNFNERQIVFAPVFSPYARDGAVTAREQENGKKICIQPATSCAAGDLASQYATYNNFIGQPNATKRVLRRLFIIIILCSRARPPPLKTAQNQRVKQFLENLTNTMELV